MLGIGAETDCLIFATEEGRRKDAGAGGRDWYKSGTEKKMKSFEPLITGRKRPVRPIHHRSDAEAPG